MGELVARATTEGYRVAQGRAPFHGYYYKILTRQGSNAPGGAMDYVVRGNMIGGFALVAYPAEYDNSGVMTFIVNQQGIVYEKDLGPNTAGMASQHDGVRPGFDLAESGQRRDPAGGGRPVIQDIHIFFALSLGKTGREPLDRGRACRPGVSARLCASYENHGG